MLLLSVKTIIRLALLGFAAYLGYTAPGVNSLQFTNCLLALILASTGD